jgi:hypothetical protein
MAHLLQATRPAEPRSALDTLAEVNMMLTNPTGPVAVIDEKATESPDHSEAGEPTLVTKPRPRRRAFQLALTLALCLAGFGATGVGAPEASASAYSCTVSSRTFNAPTGYFCADTQGSGRYVRSVAAGFSTSNPAHRLCNTRVRVTFIDTRGVAYRTLLSGIQSSCVMYGQTHKWNLNYTARAGHIRYELLSNGAVRSAVHHTIR